MMSINESWIWLGPVVAFCLYLMLQHVVVDIFRGLVKDLKLETGNSKLEAEKQND